MDAHTRTQTMLVDSDSDASVSADSAHTGKRRTGRERGTHARQGWTRRRKHTTTVKPVFVPALHAELTEYTNLVRVLRTWTPWPLIDCPVPEWSLQDEIQHLAESGHLVHILDLLPDRRLSAPGSMQNRLWRTSSLCSSSAASSTQRTSLFITAAVHSHRDLEHGPRKIPYLKINLLLLSMGDVNIVRGLQDVCR